jgi:hypothetical protein
MDSHGILSQMFMNVPYLKRNKHQMNPFANSRFMCICSHISRKRKLDVMFSTDDDTHVMIICPEAGKWGT